MQPSKNRQTLEQFFEPLYVGSGGGATLLAITFIYVNNHACISWDMLRLISNHIWVFPSKTLRNHQKNSNLNLKFGWPLGIKNVRLDTKNVWLDMIISDCIQLECVGHSKVLLFGPISTLCCDGWIVKKIAWATFQITDEDWGCINNVPQILEVCNMT